jgi:hypothetical protein
MLKILGILKLLQNYSDCPISGMPLREAPILPVIKMRWRRWSYPKVLKLFIGKCLDRGFLIPMNFRIRIHRDLK